MSSHGKVVSSFSSRVTQVKASTRQTLFGRMYHRTLVVVTCWHCVVLAGHSDTGSAISSTLRHGFHIQLVTRAQDGLVNYLNTSFGHQLVVECFFDLSQQNQSLRLACLELTSSKQNVSSHISSCGISKHCYQRDAIISFTADSVSTQRHVYQSGSIHMYVFTVVCAGIILLLLFAAVFFLMRKQIHRECLKKPHDVRVDDREQPRYENIRNQICSSTGTARKDAVQETSNGIHSEQEQYQNCDTDLSEYTSASSISQLVKKTNWSATNSSIKESSFNDDIDDSSDSVSVDDSGKDSGSLYIAPSHGTTSSDDFTLNSKSTRYLTPKLPPVAMFTRKGDHHHGVGELLKPPTPPVSRTKQRGHVTWKDAKQNIKNITEELNSRQCKVPNAVADCSRYPFKHPIILSRNFSSQQMLASSAQVFYDAQRIDNTGAQVQLNYETKQFYSESDLADVCSVSTTSINRFSTVAHANQDVTRASVCSSSSVDGAHGVNSRFRRNNIRCLLESSSDMSSVSQKSHAV